MKNYWSFCFIAFLLVGCNPPEHNFSFAIDVFPNPCTDRVSLRISNEIEFLNLEPISLSADLVDAKTGDNIANIVFRNNEEIFTVDMTPYEPGQYYINFFANENMQTSDVFLKIN